MDFKRFITEERDIPCSGYNIKLYKLMRSSLKRVDIKKHFLPYIPQSPFERLNMCIIIIFIIISSIKFNKISKIPVNPQIIPIEINCNHNLTSIENIMCVDAVGKEIIRCIDEYINVVVKNHAKSSKASSPISGKSLFEQCMKYDVDVCFVLAQAQLESHFGTSGQSVITKCVWSVGAHDNRSTDDMKRRGLTFSNPNESIRPFLKELTSNWMGGDTTEYDLMKSYINKDGKRYASDLQYEEKLTCVYNKIKNNTRIYELMQLYKKLINK